MITSETLILSFIAGIYTPLGAVCVLPLYPGYLAYLASANREGRMNSPLYLGLIVSAGAIGSMLLFGLLFVTIMNTSLSTAIRLMSPIIYILLVLLGAGMILGLDPGRLFPGIEVPKAHSQHAAALLYGGFFGLVALPCNPAGLLMIFALSATIPEAITSLVHFIVFGIGMATPLLLLSALSEERVSGILRVLTTYQEGIRRGAGIIILSVALYYLIHMLFPGLL
ncbi:cytochrome c biogenesis CcdA family protein [Methanocalculus sp. MC3]